MVTMLPANSLVSLGLWFGGCLVVHGFTPDIARLIKPPKADYCAGISDQQRLDCYPDSGSNEGGCLARGCCWQAADSENTNVPWCFFSTKYQSTGYVMGEVQTDSTGKSVSAQRQEKSFFPNDIMTIQLDAYYETNDRLRLKIYDPSNARYEVPQKFVQRPADGKTADGTDPNYKIDFAQNGFAIDVTRTDGSPIFSAISDNFIYADQLLQISLNVPGPRLYGLGEHRGPLMYDLSNWQILSMWNRDQPPCENCNLYGTHPMYVMITDDGRAHGFVLMNSNAMDVTLQPCPIITWRTVGGILDMYVLTGPTPAEVMRQYLDLIGRPLMPPYWSLGFHLSRYGLQSSNDTMSLVQRIRDLEYPQEVQWNDIDYMDAKMDFTYDHVNYDTLPQVVQNIHNYTQRYMMILDPGIADFRNNSGLTSGNELHVWCNRSDGVTPLEGNVWPGNTYYPDFTSSNAETWYYNNLKEYHDQIPFDGIWIDMNEPSNFVAGSTTGCDSSNTLDNPPYVPAVIGGSLYDKTMCPSALQEAGVHYNLHNMYGHTNSIVANAALKKLYKTERPFIITRSTYMSSGRYSHHWTGDNNADWDNIKYSVAAIINTNIYGISMIGADICGFMGSTTQELCTRWTQLGAFYTFMRNHNNKGSPDQDPSVWPTSTRDIMKKYTLIRYGYLPYLYTELYEMSTVGDTVLTALAFAFPEDKATYPIDTQFMWGQSIMVAPVLTDGARTLEVYFPQGVNWYDLETSELVSTGGESKTVDAPIDKMPLYIKSGSIIVTQTPALYLTETRQNNFQIQVFLADTTGASGTFGQLFWDDGITDGTIENGDYSLVGFSASYDTVSSSGYLVGRSLKTGYSTVPKVDAIRIIGVSSEPTGVFLDDKSIGFTYDDGIQALYVSGQYVDLLENFTLSWSSDNLI